MIQFLVSIFLTVCLGACSLSKPPPRREDDDSPNSPARLAAYKAEYASKHAMYRCDQSELPAVQIHPFNTKRICPLALSRGLVLRLKLGRKIEKPGATSYRTMSKYVLSTAAGNELARAESMMCKLESEGCDGEIKVLFTPSENCVLVEEETFGAGSTIRHVVFIPAAVQKSGQAPLAWRAFHLDLPERGFGVGEGEHVGTVHGIAGGKIFVEMDDAFYAFPLEKFVTTELGVSNG
ncbi:hypothetical protein [Prosthecobacter sp.]|uniref:hypothetical protein n=1 Tax=Prosthecobacter sp. TaxID=1965333 RepID=UPI003782DA89